MEEITKNILAINSLGHFAPGGVSEGTGYDEWDRLGVVYEDGEVVNVSVTTYYASKKQVWERFVNEVPYIGNPKEALPMLLDAVKDNNLYEEDIPNDLLQVKYLFPPTKGDPRKYRYRIRKLSPRECYRLMAVRDSDIDKMQSAGISESRQYQLAGNSIVVDCLVNGIFKNLFIESDKPQDTLF